MRRPNWRRLRAYDDGGVEGGLGDPERLAGEEGALDGEALHHHGCAAALAPEHVVGGHDAVFEQELGGRRAAMADLVELLADREARE